MTFSDFCNAITCPACGSLGAVRGFFASFVAIHIVALRSYPAVRQFYQSFQHLFFPILPACTSLLHFQRLNEIRTVQTYFSIPALAGLPTAAALILLFSSFNFLWAAFFCSYSSFAILCALSPFVIRLSAVAESKIASKESFSKVLKVSLSASSRVLGMPHFLYKRNSGRHIFGVKQVRSAFFCF